MVFKKLIVLIEGCYLLEVVLGFLLVLIIEVVMCVELSVMVFLV